MSKIAYVSLALIPEFCDNCAEAGQPHKISNADKIGNICLLSGGRKAIRARETQRAADDVGWDITRLLQVLIGLPSRYFHYIDSRIVSSTFIRISQPDSWLTLYGG